MAKGKKFYVVWVGNKPGIYDSWKECQLQINGYPDAKYKSFKSLQEAKSAFVDSFSNHYKSSTADIQKTKKSPSPTSCKIIKASISVDAACSGNPGLMEYRGVDTFSKTELFHHGPFQEGTNNVGEFLAIVHGLAWLKTKNDATTAIYTDSRTAMAWVRNKKVKTLLNKTKSNAILFELMDRAITWLHNNQWSNPIIKWETKDWGEIPADFGRK